MKYKISFQFILIVLLLGVLKNCESHSYLIYQNNTVSHGHSSLSRIENTYFNGQFKNVTYLYRKRRADPQNCRVLISEVNTDNPGSNQFQFIELEKKCSQPLMGKPPVNPLSNYKLLIIRGSPLELVFSLDFSDPSIVFSESHKKSRFFVIGSKRVLNNLIDIQSSEAVQSIVKNAEDIELLPTGDDSQYAVVLLYNPLKTVRREIQLYKNTLGFYEPNSNIKEPLFSNIIKNNAKDMLIYGRKIESSSCTFFDSIWPDYVSTLNHYFFRDWDPQNSQTDHSINRCTESTYGFQPLSFRIGLISPGTENNCDGQMFYLEAVKSSLMVNNIDEIVVMDICNEDSNIEIPKKRFRGVSETSYHSYVSDGIQKAQTQCANSVESGLAFATSRMEINVKDELIKRLGYEPQAAAIHRNTFKPEWADQCRKYFPNGATVLDNMNVRSWLNIKVESERCVFFCTACKFYFNSGFRVDVKHKSNMESTGYFSKLPSLNLKAITDHEKKNVHIAATKFLYDFSAASKEGEFLNAIKKAEDAQLLTYLPTIRMVRLVYAEIIADVSFNKHSVFVDVVKTFNVDLGVHHYNNEAAKDITNTIGTSFHDTLINYMVTQNRVFSLMVDETTDSRNVPYMICYFQAIEDGYPIVYFYSLINLKYGGTAEQLFRSFREQVQSDNAINPQFELFFKSKIGAIATDGASVMRAPFNSFRTKLNAYVERNVPYIQCMAHKLELSIKRALVKNPDKRFKYFKKFEKSINKVYSFYMSRGSKRFMHLVQIGEELQLETRRIRYNFDLRWSSSHFYAIKSLHDDLDALRLDLVSIEGDSAFSESAKADASDLYARLSDKTYCAIIMEYLDFLTVYKQLSLTLQQASGVLIGKYDIIQSGIVQLERLQQQVGPHLETFLKLVECSNICQKGTCTLEQYDDCETVIYTKPNENANISPVVQVLSNSENSTFKLRDIRSIMYDSLIAEIKSYFDLELLSSFDIFNPREYNLPVCSSNKFPNAGFEDNENDFNIDKQINEVAQIPENDFTYLQVAEYETKVNRVCQFLVMNEQDCIHFKADWMALMVSILNNVELVKNFQEEDFARFWPLALQYNQLPWTPIITDIIQRALTIPFSTSDCERGFRYVTTIKSNERSALSPFNLEQLVRIKVNGPKDIKYFQAEKYAELYLRKHVRVDDLTSSGGRKVNTEKFRSFFRDSRLF